MKVLRYIIAGLFIIAGLNWIFNPEVESVTYSIEGFFILAVALFILPFMAKFLKKNVRLAGAIGSFVILSGLIYINMGAMDEKNQLKNAEAEKIYAGLTPLLESGNIDSAAAVAREAKASYANTENNPAAKFLKDYDSLNSPTFFEEKLLSISDIQFEDIKKGFNVSILENKHLNSEFMKRLLEKEKDRAVILADIRKKKEHEERQALIEKQFSKWDGSHPKLTEMIKNSMNDPDSYEHVETLFGDRGDFLLVQTTFRGKNAFNATIKNSVTAKVDFSGNVLEIVEQSW